MAVLIIACCQGREITGGYGRAVAGHVTKAAGMSSNSPEGVKVDVGMTGMSAVLGTGSELSLLLFSTRCEVAPSCAVLPWLKGGHIRPPFLFS